MVGRAADGLQALELVLALQPDVLVSDIETPGLSGTVTTFGQAGYLRGAPGAGLRGYLLKDVPSAGLAAAVRTVAAGGKAISRQLAEAIPFGVPRGG